MTDQEHYIILVVDDKEFLCLDMPQLFSQLQANSQYTFRTIKFYRNKEYNEKSSKLYNLVYNK